MFKTLYVRTVAIYLGIVIFSVAFSLLLTILLFFEKTGQDQKEVFEEKAELIMDFYEQMQPEDFQAFMNHLAQTSSLSIQLIDQETSHVQTFNLPKKTQLSKLEKEISAFTIPWERDGTVYQMTLIEAYPEGNLLELMTLLSLIVLTSIVLVLIATRYLVRPVNAVTSVAKEISMGNFNVRLPTTRGDELGSLAVNINHMATELGQLEREREAFVANVSHEFQSPLTSIRGFSSMLLNDDMPPKDQQRALTIIQQESDRLSRLSDNLLKLTMLDSNKHISQPIQYNVAEQIRRMVFTLEPQWTQKKLQVEMNAEKTLLVAEKDLMNQVWINLMSNAIKFTPPGGKISIHISTSQHYIEVRFKDNGIPIPSEEFGRIFSRFHKVDRMRDRNINGSGLGLSIVKKIIERHRGKVYVYQESETEKSFVVLIPKSTTHNEKITNVERR
ncbi:HAMP domain-containing protein [Salipaludibacillus agaradhaerens]|uniref:sensor histidine kinase n=1 Tax=Salipaludibacillus agaradhaerens TaxID=76935 RepID=UPI002150E65C|nr:HAMP domain-containing sensor histidine kinase [Salipaludibacillus agaradhaerens]MCR6108480.1 HAMP domain-containing protein [Salipaludibacillus agaradhaerens]MCR6120501.1 HAMP domain-containing protein [Salipaludibacillus agaradhaerens]